MKRSLLFLLILLTSCKVQHAVGDHLISVEENVHKNDFSFLDNLIQDKDIVILGEASHGDGHTFEIKSELVRYLIEEKSFNTFAFEARDFLQMEYISNREPLHDLFNDSFKENWVRNWSPWGPAKEIEVLVDLFSQKQIAPVGLETYSKQSESLVIPLLQKELEKLTVSFEKQPDWKLLNILHEKIFENTEKLSKDAQEYTSILQNMYDEVEVFKQKDNSFALQLIQNAISSAQLEYLRSQATSDSNFNYNESITIRDRQMANNLIWFKKNNPKAKIIVWMANFHGAKKLSDAYFEGVENFSYQNQKVFGEYITDLYGEKVFSLAFTSSRGVSKMPYDFEGVEEKIITAPSNSLENQLDFKNINYGFIDFTALRKDKKINNKEFNSIMLGYVNQRGKWLNIFDGLFYIKENKKATSIY